MSLVQIWKAYLGAVYVFFCLQLPLTVFINQTLNTRLASVTISLLIAFLSLSGFFISFYIIARDKYKIAENAVIVSMLFFLASVLLASLMAIRSDIALSAILASGYHYALAPVMFFVLYSLRLLYGNSSFGKILIKLVICATFSVYTIAFFQYYFLPIDILDIFGYSNQGIRPFQYIGSDMSALRVMSTLSGPNTLGVYTALMLPLLIYSRKIFGGKFRVLIDLCIVLTPFVLYSSKSRSGLVAACVVATIEILRYRREITRVIKRWFKLSIFIGVSATILLLFSMPHVVELSRDILFRGNSNGVAGSDVQRIESWRNSIAGIASNPLGYGLGTAGVGSSYDSQGPNIIESSYLQITYELGMFGLVSWLGFYLTLLYYASSIRFRDQRYMVMAVLLSFAVVNMFLPIMNEELLPFAVLIITALFLPLRIGPDK